ncbi:MAG: XrtA system polysaccharide chain length determinant [Pseudomonadota bacterium]
MQTNAPANSVHDSLILAVDLLRAIWRKRWLVLIVAIAICSVGWPVALLLPYKYEARTRVYVDTKTMLRPLLQGLAVDAEVTQQFAYVTRRTLLSRPNLEKVVHETDLDLLATDQERLEKIIRDLGQKIDISGDVREGIYTIGFTNSDPKIAYKVVQVLLNIFVETSLGASRSDTDLTQQFLTDQIKEYEEKLVQAETRLKEFKQKNIGLLPTQAGGYFARMDQAKTNWHTAELALNEAINKRDALKRQLFGQEEFVGVAPGNTRAVVTDPLDARIINLESKLDELLLKYTDQHPNVVSVKESLRELRRQKAADAVRTGSDSRKSEEIKQSNPVYQELKIDLGRSEAEVAGLRVRVMEYEREMLSLKQMVETVPKVEAELASLDRDYNINKQNYEALVARRESARLSREADANKNEVQFKIIEPPRVPAIPLGPNRPLLLTAVLLLGLAGGVGGVVLFRQIKPTFSSIAALRTSFPFPVLGAVGKVRESAKKGWAKYDGLLWFLSMTSLGTTYLALIIAQIF